MIKSIIKSYNSPSSDGEQLMNTVSNFAIQEFSGKSKVLVNNKVVAKRKFSLLYNSFLPNINISISEKEPVKVVYEFPCKNILRLFCLINILFLAILFVVSIIDKNCWVYCTIPLGILLFSVALSYLLFVISVKTTSRLFEEIFHE